MDSIFPFEWCKDKQKFQVLQQFCNDFLIPGLGYGSRNHLGKVYHRQLRTASESLLAERACRYDTFGTGRFELGIHSLGYAYPSAGRAFVGGLTYEF